MEKWKMKVRRKSADYNKSHFVRYRNSPVSYTHLVLIPVWAFSLVLALFCAAVLSGAQLRVWRKQERVERVRRETTAALAHELKTPLSVLSATAELLGDNLAPEKQAHYLGVIQQQAHRMDGSVRQMLELSRLETGAKALRRTAFSLAELVSSVGRRARTDAPDSFFFHEQREDEEAHALLVYVWRHVSGVQQ